MVTSTTADSRPVPSLGDAEAYVAMICFKHGPPERVGVELEWTVHHRDSPARPLDPAQLADALGDHAPPTVAPGSPHLPLPDGSHVTVEPGGQVEISSAPDRSVGALLDAVARDTAALDSLLASAGLVRGTTGIDSHRVSDRILDVPRYAAMQSFFDRIGPWGSSMMCSTASTQVCLDAGEEADTAVRWTALHSVGPALVALFANSPVVAGRDTGWASNRVRATLGTCPPVTHPLAPGGDPVGSWVRSAMTAPVLCVRREGRCWDVPRPTTFAEWVTGSLGTAPTYDDLDYHLSTLFPPVRPRGYVEVRYVDAQPPDAWHHPAVLLAALMSSRGTVERAAELTEHCADRWLAAARHGLDDPTLREAARDLVDLAADHLDPDLSPGLADDLVDTLQRRTAPNAARRLPA